MKRYRILVIAAALTLGISAWSQDPLSPQVSDGGSVGPSADSARDKLFIRQGAEGNLAEIEFGKLAVQKGNTDEVKNFGQKMIDDHTTLIDNMKPMMEKYGVRTPEKMDKEAQGEYDKLATLSGTDFDTAYITAMVKMHLHDLRAYKMEAQATGDRDLRAATGKALETIAEHARAVYGIAKARGIALPKRKGPPPHPAPQQ